MNLSSIDLGLATAPLMARVQAKPRTAEAGDTSAGAGVPLTFDAAGSWCFGWFHRAAAPARGVGVLLCRPIGYEAMCTYHAYTQLAETLAQAGFDVLRFDYQGTGDSAGGDGDPDRVAAWLESTERAVAELRRLAGVSRLAMFGVRLGATLAAHVAARVGGIESLVMWAPCPSGRVLVRELRAAAASRAQPASGQSGDIEALGSLHTAQTLQDLQALDCVRLATPPAARVLVIGRDDIPGEGPLPAHYRSLGIETRFETWPGYSRMMVEPHAGVVEQGSLNAITQWLAGARDPHGAASPPAALPLPRVRSAELPGGVCEAPFTFGAKGSLFGILAEPGDTLDVPDARLRRHTAALLLNVGGNYRVGPNRLYVKMARELAARGFPALRLDLSGIGDSRDGAGAHTGSYYSRSAAADVRAAIDALAARGCTRFYVMGVCSGSYAAYQTALADPRVTGQVLMNSRLLELRDGADADTLQASMQMHYKSTAFYGRALLQPQVYRRLLRGEVDVRGIAARVRVLLQARLARAGRRLLGRSRRDESVLASTRRLGQRGTETLMVMGAEDDGRDYVEFHFGRQGSRLKGDPNFRMVVVEDCDHTFSSVDSQRAVIREVVQHLERRLADARQSVQ
jgi:alpha-beta hydrolase superfamily lysophospholipase